MIEPARILDVLASDVDRATLEICTAAKLEELARLEETGELAEASRAAAGWIRDTPGAVTLADVARLAGPHRTAARALRARSRDAGTAAARATTLLEALDVLLPFDPVDLRAGFAALFGADSALMSACVDRLERLADVMRLAQADCCWARRVGRVGDC